VNTYFYDEGTGDGAVLPDRPINLAELRLQIKTVLDAYISPRQKIATDKIAEELEILMLQCHLGIEVDKQFPPIKLYDPGHGPKHGDYGE